MQAAFPGVVEALHLLSEKYVLFTASTGSSRELEHALTGMGVRKLFRRLYGPDLINVPKTGRRYYERLFEHSGINPRTALVVDDKPEFLDHATELSAHTVLVSREESMQGQRPRVAALAELPALLDRVKL